MAVDFAIQFGSYVYATEGVTVEKVSDPLAVRTRMAATPGRSGAYSAGGLLDTRKFTLEGLIAAADRDDLRDAWDGFRAAHLPGAPAAFYLSSDRYRLAEVVGIGKAEWDGMAGAYLRLSVEFAATEPYDYAATATSTTGLASGGTVTAAGEVATRRVTWTLVVGTAGTITIENTTTGEQMVLTVATTGTYVVDVAAETVTKSGVDMGDTFAGAFAGLAVGANTIAVSTSGGAVVTTLSCSHRDAWA